MVACLDSSSRIGAGDNILCSSLFFFLIASRVQWLIVRFSLVVVGKKSFCILGGCSAVIGVPWI